MAKLTYTEEIVFTQLSRLDLRGRLFVSTRYITAQLSINLRRYYDDRTIRAILVRLETKGLIERKGQRGGWKRVNQNNAALRPYVPSYLPSAWRL